jgi:hypothetical protein
MPCVLTPWNNSVFARNPVSAIVMLIILYPIPCYRRKEQLLRDIEAFAYDGITMLMHISYGLLESFLELSCALLIHDLGEKVKWQVLNDCGMEAQSQAGNSLIPCALCTIL